MISHLIRIVGIPILINICIFYPFFPGQYDSLAMPLSIVAQVGVAFGLLLVPIGILWLIYELRKSAQIKRNRVTHPKRHSFALVSIIAFSIIASAISLVAFAVVGFSLAILSAFVWAIFFPKLVSNLKSMKAVEHKTFSYAPIYFVFVPVVALLVQFVLAAPMTNFSREYATVNSKEYISDIEGYHAQHGNYPNSLLAMWKDYDPNVVGIEKFHYSPTANAYNLFFEQPRLLFDNIGTREWFVYNPLDEHQMFSHTSWFLLLPPEELPQSQGWYAVHDTPYPHWKYFWFD